MAFEIEGTIKVKLGVEKGQSARGEWARQAFVVEYQDGNFPSEICFTVFGADKIAELDNYGVGDQVKVSFNVKSREYNGKWYSDIRAWRISGAGDGQGQAPQRQSFAPQPQQAPAPSISDMPADSSADDLPF